MSDKTIIKIRKGLDIRIPGVAVGEVEELPSSGLYAVKTGGQVGLTPKLLVSEGDRVAAGDVLFVDKNNDAARYVSPVDGKVSAIVRGAKRALLAVVVERDGDSQRQLLTEEQLKAICREDIVDTMIEKGLWTLIKQRPFGIVPSREAHPKGVFVSAIDSSPLPVDVAHMLDESDFRRGIEILDTIAGPVHLSLPAGDESFLAHVPHARIHYFEGPHPTGLVGTQIAHIDPISKGETVWTLGVQDVAVIGHLFRTGCYRPERLVALCGPLVKAPHYYRTLAGASIAPLADNIVHQEGQQVRLIEGSVLSGSSMAADDYIGASCDKICVLPEGDYYDFMGWLRPNFKKFSFSRTFLSGFLTKCNTSKPQYTFDTGRHGSQRPLFVTGEFEKLVPLDIYPMQLVKACIAGNIERMEELGIYEVEPEDLALCEFADTSKTEIQAVIREGLEKIRKEVGI